MQQLVLILLAPGARQHAVHRHLHLERCLRRRLLLLLQVLEKYTILDEEWENQECLFGKRENIIQMEIFNK
jgi:hypothetical protein